MSDMTPREAAERIAEFMQETQPWPPQHEDDPAGGFYEAHGRHVFLEHTVAGYGHVSAADLRILIDHARAAAPEDGDLARGVDLLDRKKAEAMAVYRDEHLGAKQREHALGLADGLGMALSYMRAALRSLAPSAAAPPREDEDIDPHRLGEALDFAWSAWIGDVGHVPDAFHLHPADARVSATFADSEFARLAAGRYDALTAKAGTVRDPERAS